MKAAVKILLGLTLLLTGVGITVYWGHLLENKVSKPIPIARAKEATAPTSLALSPAPPRFDVPVHYRDKVVVLMFHNIDPTYQGRGTITPETFEADVKALVEKGYNVITAEQLVSFLEGKTRVPPNAVVITFDDGYKGTYLYAFPVLKKYRVPATVFLIGSLINHHPNFLTWEEVREMAQSGLVTFGGHTYDLHKGVPIDPYTTSPATVARIYDLRTGKSETAEAYHARVLEDSQKEQELFRQEIGKTSPFFAYPYGAYTPELDRALKEAGYSCFFTTLHGANCYGQDPHHIFRINAGAPWITPEKLLQEIRATALGTPGPRKFPPDFIPKWTQKPIKSSQSHHQPKVGRG
ncbi:polysaccharide deacetylase family protein [Ammonifex thiophilus]|uniref:Polysaccharide deacetylase n=1 Tax=Ammonifex thiophilus TaxID=444093 RepID=A0A3D8P3R2_9THEO|nr:polysaccharide deacetylase family protein [Ammonifex thiophilus]RDV81291.1 polysaccharide deacetylase [Ammonifex thiophilus]